MKLYATIALTLTLLLTSGCTTRLAGTVSNGRYISAQGDFSLPVPVDIRPGGDGQIGDTRDGVTFTHLFDRSIAVYCIPHSKEITLQNRHETMRNLLKLYYPSPSFVHDEFLPEVQTGTTFVIWPEPTDSLEGPRKLGIAGFWTETRAVIATVNIAEAQRHLSDGLSFDKQVSLLRNGLIPIIESITIHERTMEGIGR